MKELKSRIKTTQQIVEIHVNKAKQKQKKYYDKKAKAVKVSVGDNVLVRKMAFDGKHKIADKFEEGTYVVIDQPRVDIPVFKVKERDSDREKTVHRNLLVLIDSQDGTDTSEIDVHDIDVVISKSFDDFSKEKRDVTEEEEEEDGLDFVVSTRHIGDAQDPILDDEVDVSSTLTEAIDLIEVDERIDPPVEDVAEEVEAEEVHQEAEQLLENRTDADTEAPIPSNTEAVEDQTIDTSTTEVGSTEVDVQRNVPVPVPRRSSRTSQPPVRFEDYYMKQMVARPYDSKLQALTVLLNSGILDNMDSTIAHSVVGAIMK